MILTRTAVGLVAAFLATASPSHPQSGQSRPAAAALAVPVFVTNESGVTRRFELRVDSTLAIDRVVGGPEDLTGRVMLDTLRLLPGAHELILIDHLRNQRYVTRLLVRPGALCIYISLMKPRTEFRAGNYICSFA